MKNQHFEKGYKKMRIVKDGTLHEKAGYIEYKMPNALAVNILKTRKGTDQTMDPQAYLCKVVNEEYGLKGECIKVTRY